MTPDLYPEVRRAAFRRRSIRAYTEEPVPEDVLGDLLEAAGRAPSAWNLQPWRWVVVRRPELKSRLHAAAFRQRQVESASAVLVLYTDLAGTLNDLQAVLHPAWNEAARHGAAGRIQSHFATQSPAQREEWGLGQAYLALGYLLLLAECRGLATSPMLGFDEAEVRNLLALPEHARVAALVAVGYAAEEGTEPHRLPPHSIIRWE